MNPDAIHVNHDALSRVNGYLTNAAKKMDQALNTFESIAQKKIAAGWEGEQTEAYLQAKAQWDKIIAEMHAHLGLQAIQITTTSQDFASTDRAAAARFGGVSVPR